MVEAHGCDGIRVSRQDFERLSPCDIPHTHGFVESSGYQEIRTWIEIEAENKIRVANQSSSSGTLPCILLKATGRLQRNTSRVPTLDSI